MYGDTAMPQRQDNPLHPGELQNSRGCVLRVQVEVFSMGGIYMEKPKEIRKLGKDCPGGSEPVWEWGPGNRFKVYYDRKMMCPYVLCLNGQVHAMFSSLEDVETYVWECW